MPSAQCGEPRGAPADGETVGDQKRKPDQQQQSTASLLLAMRRRFAARNRRGRAPARAYPRIPMVAMPTAGTRTARQSLARDDELRPEPQTGQGRSKEPRGQRRDAGSVEPQWLGVGAVHQEHEAKSHVKSAKQAKSGARGRWRVPWPSCAERAALLRRWKRSAQSGPKRIAERDRHQESAAKIVERDERVGGEAVVMNRAGEKLENPVGQHHHQGNRRHHKSIDGRWQAETWGPKRACLRRGDVP
mgnify:CR=1 FL=1